MIELPIDEVPVIPEIPQERWAAVFEQRYRLLDAFLDANNHLEERAYKLLEIGGILAGFVAFSGLVAAPIKGWLAVWMLLVLLSFVGMVAILVYHFTRPVAQKHPGDTEWNETFTDFLWTEKINEQLLYDLHRSIDRADEQNDHKAKWLTNLAYLLAAEIVCLFGVVLQTAIP